MENEVKSAASREDELVERLEEQCEYSIQLQRIIEAICHGNALPVAAAEGAPWHYAMAKEYLSPEPYMWVYESPGYFDPATGGEPPYTDFSDVAKPGYFPLYRHPDGVSKT